LSEPLRVLIADDHALFRDGMRAIFMGVSDIEVVGEAASGEEAISQARKLKPELILMDIQMEPMNGIEACKRILEELPDIHIIMLTMLEDSDSLFAAMVAGAKSYVLKGARRADVLKTIRAVADGEILFGPGIANRMSHFFRSMDGSKVRATPDSNPFPELTVREARILELIAQGLNNHAIGEKLNIAPKTVANHVSNILNKLQVTDRAQAIIKAREAGLGKDTL
jgi:DNA-binding NarL/FixJ family response regulator